MVRLYDLFLDQIPPKIAEKNDIPDGALHGGGIRRQPPENLTGTRRHIFRVDLKP